MLEHAHPRPEPRRRRRLRAAQCDCCGRTVKLEAFHITYMGGTHWQWVRAPDGWCVLVGGDGVRVRCPECFQLMH